MDCSLPDPQSMGFSQQKYWSGLLFSLPGDLSDSWIELESLRFPVLADRFFTTVPSGSYLINIFKILIKFLFLKTFIF